MFVGFFLRFVFDSLQVALRAIPGFDIVSEVSSMEIENAVNPAKTELANRLDFKGPRAEIVLEKNEIKLSAEDQFRIKALVEIVIAKLFNRQISLKNVDKGEPGLRPSGTRGRLLKSSKASSRLLQEKIPMFIRDTKLKVTMQIQV